MSIGDKIRNARINKGINQKELADMLTKKGIHTGNTTICNWENGTSKPDPDTIAVICEILNVDANYILGFDNEKNIKNSKPFSQTEILFDKTKDILSDDDRELIEHIMKKTIDKYEQNKNNNQ